MASPALPFDQDEFCHAVTEIAHRMNARKGRWLDRSRRHDGVAVDCEAKTIEIRRFLNADPDAMRQGWEARKKRQWSAAYCSDETWREAIDNGWSISEPEPLVAAIGPSFSGVVVTRSGFQELFVDRVTYAVVTVVVLVRAIDGGSRPSPNEPLTP